MTARTPPKLAGLVTAQTPPKPAGLDRQIGGSHYRSHAIQPLEIAMGNQLDAARAFALKHMTRPSKGQVRMDIEKTLHYIELAEANYWPSVSVDKFIAGLDQGDVPPTELVPDWMKDVARSLLHASGIDKRYHLDKARAALRLQLAALDAQTHRGG